MSNTEYTLCLIKPNVTCQNRIGAVMQRIEDEDFHIVAMKYFVMPENTAEVFYAVHKQKPFFHELMDFMTSEHTLAIALERVDAIATLRRLAGNTNPEKAEEGTIRKQYGESVTKNAVHASDSIEHAREELAILFPELPLNF